MLPGWRGLTVVILGGGPSLTREQFRLVASARVEDRIRAIAVNDSYLLAPWADLCHAADSHWHRWHTEGIDKPVLGMRADQVRNRWAEFEGQKSTVQGGGDNVADQSVHVIAHREGMGVSADPRLIISGRNSGFQALNIALLAGAARILLLGFDGQPAADGRGHWHGAHLRPTPIAAYSVYRKSMDAAKGALGGVKVLNCSPSSAIETFPKTSLEEVL